MKDRPIEHLLKNYVGWKISRCTEVGLEVLLIIILHL